MSEQNETLPASAAQYPAKLSALPVSWIDKIFGHMGAYYGSLFADRWKDCDIAEVKRVWAESLANFSDNPECFKASLRSMIDECQFPPTLPEFVALCRKHYVRPPMQQAALPNLGHQPLSRDEGRRRLEALKAKFPTMTRVLDEIRVE
jgi:hypothetical protein